MLGVEFQEDILLGDVLEDCHDIGETCFDTCVVAVLVGLLQQSIDVLGEKVWRDFQSCLSRFLGSSVAVDEIFTSLVQRSVESSLLVEGSVDDGGGTRVNFEDGFDVSSWILKREW